MKRGIRAREFIRKYSNFREIEKKDIEKAIHRVLASPEDNSFKRDYLAPYRQEHPTNKQLTIFFENFADKDKVFFVWINDNSCPHDTHTSHGEDPCLVQFKKLQQGGQLEEYCPEFHEGKLQITPRATDPHFLRFSAIDIETYTNILNDGETYYCLSLTSTDRQGDENDDLFIHHLSLFLKVIKEHFKKNNQNFELRIPPYFNEEISDHLKAAYDASDWEKIEEENIFSLKLL